MVNECMDAAKAHTRRQKSRNMKDRRMARGTRGKKESQTDEEQHQHFREMNIDSAKRKKHGGGPQEGA